MYQITDLNKDQQAVVNSLPESNRQSVIDALGASNALKRGFSLKVSPKGAMQASGFGRFPVTLYASQWELIISKVDEIKAFIAANSSSLKRRETK